MSRILIEVALPRVQPPAGRKRPRPVGPQTAQPVLFGEATPPPVSVQESPAPVPPEYRQPPLPLKVAVLDLLQQRRHPRKGQNSPRRPAVSAASEQSTERIERIDQALLHLSVLAIRHFGGDRHRREHDRRNVRHYYAHLNNAADYAYHDPEAVLRRKTWHGLAKASEQWHRDEAIRKMYLDIEQQAAEAGYGDEWWDAPLGVHRTADFTAYLLKTPAELLQESQVMRHCASSGHYIDRCHNGYSRIFHMQPAGVTVYEPESQKQHGTTVQIEQAPQGWYVSHHQGYRNRDPDGAEDAWADQLLAAWRTALKDAHTGASGSLQ